MNLTIQCPHCNSMLSVDECYLGQEVSCSQCSKNFIVNQSGPAPAAATNSFPPPPAPQIAEVYSQPTGTSFNPDQNYYPRQNCGKAVASLICGIFGLLCCQICSVVAIALGFLAKGEIKKANGRLEGDTMATVGIVLGFLGVLWAIIVFLSIISGMFTGIWESW